MGWVLSFAVVLASWVLGVPFAETAAVPSWLPWIPLLWMVGLDGSEQVSLRGPTRFRDADLLCRASGLTISDCFCPVIPLCTSLLMTFQITVAKKWGGGPSRVRKQHLKDVKRQDNSGCGGNFRQAMPGARCDESERQCDECDGGMHAKWGAGDHVRCEHVLRRNWEFTTDEEVEGRERETRHTSEIFQSLLMTTTTVATLAH